MLPPQLPAQTPAPPQAVCPLCGVAPDGRVVQVPSDPGRSQASHEPEQVRSQQMPSGEHFVPAAQPPGTAVQSWPFLLVHVPVLSQVPAQVGLSWLITAAQA